MQLILIFEWINKLRFFFRFIFIILFALIIDFITVESLGYILEDLFSIPEEEMMNGIYWGDAFISRIIVSLLGTFIGGYIIGSSLNKKEKIATFIYALPILSFWIIAVIGYYYISELPHNFDNPKFSMFSRWKLIPLITSILTMPAAYLGCHYGSLNMSKYTRTYSILNIKLYNLIWFIPTCYSFGVAVICMLVVSVFYSFWIGDNPLYSTFQVFSQNQFIIELLSIISLSLILMTSIAIFKSTYKYLSDEFTKVRFKILKIFGATIYFWILFVFTFNLPDIITLSFETDSLATKAANILGLIPKDFSSGINLSIILFSAYITEKSAVKLLRRNELINTFFDALKGYRKNFFKKIFNLFKK
ncbi:MAG: hypothetical protein VX347_03665 [Bacteroidota bacterium]|nr:hypothetical protein [Bacteroidota bacterium]